MIALGEQRALVLDDMLGEATAEAVRAEALVRFEAGALRRAGVGYRAALAPETRGDFIAWLDHAEAGPFAPVFELFEALMRGLDELAHLGARTLECQLAVYPPGSGYARHRDLVHGSHARRMTVIYYANPWQAGDGGELEIDEADGLRVIEPIADRLVVFRPTLEHAVRPVTAGPRVAVSGWLRRDP